MSLPIWQAPTAEEDAMMREEAKMVNGLDCQKWHRYCNSECCRMYSFPDKDYDLTQKTIRIFGSASPDIIWYYQLHGCTYRMPWLYVPTKHARRENGRIYIMQNCRKLTKEGKCSGHPSQKPKVCRELTIENVEKGKFYGGAQITPHCLLRFKCGKSSQETKSSILLGEQGTNKDKS